MKKQETANTYRKRGQSQPDISFEIEMRRKIQKEVDEMMADIEKKAYALWTNDRANDEMNFPKWYIVQMMKEIRNAWYGRFQDLAREISPMMAYKADIRTQRQIIMKMRDYGFTIEHRPTDAQKLIARIFAMDTVALIKTIPQAVAEQAQEAVMHAWEQGYDMKELTDSLERIGNYGRDKAQLVARDQMNKITQKMAIANAQSVGVSKGRWIHVPGYKSSRKTHIAFDREIFDLQQGLYDTDVREWVKPGELPYCNCQFQIIAPGFDE